MNAVPPETRDIAAFLGVESVSRCEENALGRSARRPLSEVRDRMLP